MTKEGWDLLPIAGGRTLPIHLLESGCQSLDASFNDIECSPIRLGVSSKNGWHGINGASACRCESCWPRSLYGTQSRRWLLGLENSLMSLHSALCGWLGVTKSEDAENEIDPFRGWRAQSIHKFVRSLAKECNI